MTQLHLPAGSTADGPFDLVVTPAVAGWGFSALRVLTLRPGVPVTVGTGDEEWIVLPQSGSLVVRVDGQQLRLAGRTGVFDGITDFAYLPLGTTAELESENGAVVALPGARARRRLEVRYGPAAGVPVELRGAGSMSRQVNNFATPDVFPTDRLIACEVITPAGNWSSYPPHKHDETSAAESQLEEIYYYRFRSLAPEPLPGTGYQHVYGTADRPVRVLEQVGDGDVVLIPHGWHGPSMAGPGADMYYLNVMAGPEDERAWKIVDDPDHGWIRGTWVGRAVDPRLPFFPVDGP
jgi:5-deoxy-glucuronate isomerase